jgi:hypothetical protein
MNKSIYNCEFTSQDLQIIYYLVEKEIKTTNRHLAEGLSDKSVKLNRYDDMLSKKKTLEETRKKIKNYYGDIDAK